MAHRGASARHRESSAAAFEDAIADGANAVETDVRRSKDGVFICHHDETLKRTAGLDVALSEIAFDELQRVAPGYAVQLEDVLERVRGRCNLLLDLKLNGEEDIRALVQLLASRKVDESIAIGVRSLRTQALIRGLDRDLVQLALILSIRSRSSWLLAGPGCACGNATPPAQGSRPPARLGYLCW